MKFEDYSTRKLRHILKALNQLEVDRSENLLDYMEWEKYPEQNDMVTSAIRRVKTKEGPNIYVIFGGNRAGKTEAGAGVIAQLFRDCPNLRIWCATLSDLSIKVQQRKLASLIRKRDIDYGEYNQIRGWKNNLIVSKKNSVVAFKTYEQGREAFQGDDLDLVWFDEEVPWDVFQEALMRLTDRQGVILLTFTALQGYTRLVNSLWGVERDDVKTTVLTQTMNPFLSKEAKAQALANVDPDEYQARILGKPHMKSGLIYKEFGDIHKIPRFDFRALVKENPNRWRISEGIDPHPRTPHHWLRFLYDDYEDILYVVDEIQAPKESMIISEFAELILNMRGRLKPEYCQIDTSSMTPDVIQKHPDEKQDNISTVRNQFALNGIPTILCTKDNAVGISGVKDRLRNHRREGKELVQKPKLYVFDDLKGIINEFQHYVWDSYQSAKIEERNETINRPKKKDDHFMDILKYEVIRRDIARPVNKNR